MKTKVTSNTVGLKELRENFEQYIKRVETGEIITVMRRSKPLFKMSGVESEDDWETVVDFTKEFGSGVPATELLASIRKLHGPKHKVS